VATLTISKTDATNYSRTFRRLANFSLTIVQCPILHAFPKTRTQQTSALLLQNVPDVAVEVVVAAKQKAAALRERHRRDSTDDVVVRVHADLLVGTDVEEQARGVVRPSRKCETTRKILLTTVHSF